MKRKLAFVFPGSGSQYAGMARGQYNESLVIRRTFEEADQYLGYRISSVILEGSTVKLNKISNMLLAIYVVSVAYFRRYIEEYNIIPDYMAGHSLGEYSALTCSGSISFENCLKIVKLRSQLAEEVMKSTGGSMTIMKNISPQVVEELCSYAREEGHTVSVACYNSPTQVSISGNDEALKIVEKRAMEARDNVQVINLIGSAPYHCVLMQSCARILENELRKYEWKEGKCKVISNVTGLPYESPSEIPEALTKQLYQPVLWDKSIEYLIKNDVCTIVEMGPQNVLKNLIQESKAGVKVYAFDEQFDRECLQNALKTVDRSDSAKEKKLKAITMCIAHASSLKNCNSSLDYDITRIRALYDEVRNIKNQIESGTTEAQDEHVEKAFYMLQRMFEAKATPIEERQNRIKLILDKTGVDGLFNKILRNEYNYE